MPHISLRSGMFHRFLIRASLLLAIACCTFSQTNNILLKLDVIVDGSKNPALIADEVAYRHFLLSIAEHQNPTPKEWRRREARLKGIGLSKADHDLLLQHLNGFHEQLNGIGSTAERHVLLDASASALKARLSQHGSTALDKYIQTHIKSHITVFRVSTSWA